MPPDTTVTEVCTLHNVTFIDFSTPIVWEEQYGIEPISYSVEKFARLSGASNSYILTNNLSHYFVDDGALSF